ncbi:MAG TPA: TetR/AcrR family transcriptional regulator [Candidatus Dormibacteraeota bacterium]|nr:TetR/AcrR family transcriptional regulator [Candidatus Dormibacteraeota bacterium]
MHHAVKSTSKRRPRGSLTREQVVDAALALADQRGLEALTIANLAAQIPCGVMTIYGYVDSKEELLDAIAQRGIRDLRLRPPLPANAEGILLAWGRALRETLHRHPALPFLFLVRAVVGPGIVRGVEMLLTRLTGVGMASDDAVHAIYAVLTYATGFAAWEMPRTVLQRPERYAATWRREFSALPPGDFPLVSGALDQLSTVAGPEQFEIGLAALASGLSGRRSSRGR